MTKRTLFLITLLSTPFAVEAAVATPQDALSQIDRLQGMLLWHKHALRNPKMNQSEINAHINTSKELIGKMHLLLSNPDADSTSKCISRLPASEV